MTVSGDVSPEQLERPAGEVSLYRYHDGAWNRVETTVRERSNGTVRFRATADGISALALAVNQSAIRVTDATLAESRVSMGERTTVRAVLRNGGAAAGTKPISLRANGTVVERRSVSVPAGESRTVAFDYVPERTGEIALAVNGTETEPLRTTASESNGTETTAKEPAESGGMLGFVVSVASAGLLMFVIAVRVWR